MADYFIMKWPLRRRWRTPYGRFSLFEAGRYIYPKNKEGHRAFIQYLGFHYSGTDLMTDIEVFLPAFQAFCMEHWATHFETDGLVVHQWVLQVFKLPPLVPYPEPGSPYEVYKRYWGGNWEHVDIRGDVKERWSQVPLLVNFRGTQISRAWRRR